MVFDHDWWNSGAFERQLEIARMACLEIRAAGGGQKGRKKAADGAAPDPRQLAELDTRTVVYLRDGFSYELKRLVDMKTTNYLSFECVAAEQSYKAGAFVVSVPFEEVCRVETFAVHPSERPDETPTIRGFGGGKAPSAARTDERGARGDNPPPEEGEELLDDE